MHAASVFFTLQKIFILSVCDLNAVDHRLFVCFDCSIIIRWVGIFADFINDIHTFAYPRIETGKEGQFPFTDKEFYLLLDMQLGGSWVGAVDSSDLPVEMEIDWVRFYQKKK